MESPFILRSQTHTGLLLGNCWAGPRSNAKVLTGLELLILLLLLPKCLGLRICSNTWLASINSVSKIKDRFGLASAFPLRGRPP